MQIPRATSAYGALEAWKQLWNEPKCGMGMIAVFNPCPTLVLDSYHDTIHEDAPIIYASEFPEIQHLAIIAPTAGCMIPAPASSEMLVSAKTKIR